MSITINETVTTETQAEVTLVTQRVSHVAEKDGRIMSILRKQNADASVTIKKNVPIDIGGMTVQDVINAYEAYIEDTADLSAWTVSDFLHSIVHEEERE